MCVQLDINFSLRNKFPLIESIFIDSMIRWKAIDIQPTDQMGILDKIAWIIFTGDRKHHMT